MFDIRTASVFTLGCDEGSITVDQPLPPTTLDKIDAIIYSQQHKEKAPIVKMLVEEVANTVYEIIVASAGYGYHTKVMEFLGKGGHLMTYVYYNGVLSLNARLTASDAKLRIEQYLDKTVVYIISGRRGNVMGTSRHAFRTPKTETTETLFAPVEGEGNPFVVTPDDPRHNDFNYRGVPALSYYNRIPLLRHSEIQYLKEINERFRTTSGVTRAAFMEKLSLENRKGLNQTFGSLYNWGLVREVDDLLYFNFKVIAQVMELLEGINYMGVSYRDNADVLNNLERLIVGKTVLWYRLNEKPLAMHLEAKTLEEGKAIVLDRPTRVAVITPQGRHVYDTWLKIQKLCEPYSRQTQQRAKQD